MAVRLGLVSGRLKRFGWAGLMWLLLQAAAEAGQVYATVDGQVIGRGELDAAVHAAMRQKFFHGRVDEARLQALRQEVGQQLIDRLLLLKEGRSRGLKPDAAEVGVRLEQELSRYNLEGLERDRQKQIKGMLRQQLEETLLIDALKEAVGKEVRSKEALLKAYYERNLDKFTTPEQLRLSVILLKVAPSAPAQSWEAARQEAGQLLERLQRGADFAKLARIHSGDASAENGGDLGYVHHGMLSTEAQAAVDGLQPGEVSSVVPLLQGIALFKLHARKVAEVNPYEQVQARVEALWAREAAQEQWDVLLSRLRSKAQIVVNE